MHTKVWLKKVPGLIMSNTNLHNQLLFISNLYILYRFIIIPLFFYCYSLMCNIACISTTLLVLALWDRFVCFFFS